MSFQIWNISCSGCTNNIEKKIKESFENKGLVSVTATLLTLQLEVIIEHSAKDIITPKAIEGVLESLGKPCKLQSINVNNANQSCFVKRRKSSNNEMDKDIKEFHLNVNGMSCSSCEGFLTKKITNINGVIEANFSALTKQAKITIDINKISIREIIEVINEGKFTANLKEKASKLNIKEAINSEMNIKKRKVLFSLYLWIPVCIMIWIFPYIYPLNKFMTMITICNGVTLYVYIIAVLSLMLQCYLGAPLYASAWNAFKNRTSNMDTLVVIGTTASIIYGIIQFFIGYDEEDSHGDINYHKSKMHEHAHCFEASCTILFVISTGKFLEAYAKSITVKRLSDLASIKVSKATLFIPNNSEEINFNGEEKQIQVELLNKNDIIKVINGQIIPTDGIVIYGYGFCDESMMTGESEPTKKEIGSKVYGGTLLHNGSLIIRVDVIEEESSLNKIIKLVANAQTSKAPIQKYADLMSSYFVPFIIVCACISWVIWFLAVYTSSTYLTDIKCKFNFAFTFGISTVVIACPCALGLATPTAVMVCTGVAASLGILIKGGDVLEKTSKLTTIVFDKTGTLTEGNLNISDFEILSDEYHEKDIFYISIVCESSSEHLVGKTISKFLLNKLNNTEQKLLSEKYTLIKSENFNGEGIVCNYKNYNNENTSDQSHTAMIGNIKLMNRHKINISDYASKYIQELENDGKIAVQIAIDNAIVMIVGLQEKHVCRKEAKSVCTYLRTHGYDIYMLTGDNKASAMKVAKILEIPTKNVIYRANPEEKLTKVSDLQKDGHQVMFVGDGVNDSPVLAQSDIGVAINSKNDITVEAANIVIMKDNLNSIIDALRLTRMAFRRIKFNFFWAFIYNIILIPVAMGILYPLFKFCLSPSLAALAMALSSISVVLSSLMIRLYKPFKMK